MSVLTVGSQLPTHIDTQAAQNSTVISYDYKGIIKNTRIWITSYKTENLVLKLFVEILYYQYPSYKIIHYKANLYTMERSN